MDIGLRKKKILKAVVEDYIKTAEPVGSKVLAERLDLGLSPATLRHEMAALEDMGYLEQPHTSAGRVPSSMGYRLYVDDLMGREALSGKEREAIDSALAQRFQELDRLIAEAGRLVSELTRYTSYTLSPGMPQVSFKRFELFLPDPSALVVVIVTTGGVVKNTMFNLSYPAEEEAVRQLTLALNTVFAGESDITPDRIQQLSALAGSGLRYAALVLDFMRDVKTQLEQREVLVNGMARLLQHPEYRDAGKVQGLLEYLSDRHEFSRALLSEPDAPMQIFIGPENVAEELRETSVVCATYPIGSDMRGLIGIVGPTRMDYRGLVSRLSYFAGRLGRLLQNENDEEKDSQW